MPHETFSVMAFLVTVLLVLRVIAWMGMVVVIRVFGGGIWKHEVGIG